MKTMFNKLILSIAVLALVSSCKDKETAVPTVAYMAMLTGAAEVPASGSAATGMLDAVYTPSTKKLTYTLSFSGLAPTAGHLHKAAVGVNGGVSLDLGAVTNGQTGMFTLTAEQEADLMASQLYVNLHTTKNPGGEIRGQVLKK